MECASEGRSLMEITQDTKTGNTRRLFFIVKKEKKKVHSWQQIAWNSEKKLEVKLKYIFLTHHSSHAGFARQLYQ